MSLLNYFVENILDCNSIIKNIILNKSKYYFMKIKLVIKF